MTAMYSNRRPAIPHTRPRLDHPGWHPADGLSLNATTGHITGTPTEDSSSNVFMQIQQPPPASPVHRFQYPIAHQPADHSEQSALAAGWPGQ